MFGVNETMSKAARVELALHLSAVYITPTSAGTHRALGQLVGLMHVFYHACITCYKLSEHQSDEFTQGLEALYEEQL